MLEFVRLTQGPVSIFVFIIYPMVRFMEHPSEQRVQLCGAAHPVKIFACVPLLAINALKRCLEIPPRARVNVRATRFGRVMDAAIAKQALLPLIEPASQLAVPFLPGPILRVVLEMFLLPALRLEATAVRVAAMSPKVIREICLVIRIIRFAITI